MARDVDDRGSDLEAEGIPDHVGSLPAKDATGDGQEGVSPPADRPTSADYGTTAAEQRAGEPLSGRLARELADPTVDTPYPDESSLSGRLVADDEGAHADTEKDAVARDVGTDRGAFSAEEAAMHVESD
jgi:hypothetical protein